MQLSSVMGIYVFCFKVQCPVLVNPMNGGILCMMSGSTPSYGDTCNSTCDNGYHLTGNVTRTCQSNGNWSGSDVVCSRGNQYLTFS